MNIKILDSFLRDYLKTTATPHAIAEKLSLTSLSVERVEKYGDDFLYELEITTNRPDLYSVSGIAREAYAILPQFGITAEFRHPIYKNINSSQAFPIEVVNDPKIVNRICAVVMEVKVGDSPKYIKERLESGDIRSLNNVVDVTNYVMRITGHPTHVFDLDRLNTKKLTIKEALKGQRIKTLDNKEHTLLGGEIVALDERNEIVDLLGIMGLANSVVTKSTKKILFFVDNNETNHIRKASMGLAIRTEAATLNEKGIDPTSAMDSLLLGIELFEKIAQGKILSKILDIYPNKIKQKTIEVSFEKINKIIGVYIDFNKLSNVLNKLGFKTTLEESFIKVEIPSFRLNDIEIEEDVVEEIARIYGYHNLPSRLPVSSVVTAHPFINNFYWEARAKEALKYWGFTEVYTYSMVSQELFDGPVENGVEISNPISEDFVYMRKTIVPSLLQVVSENKKQKQIKIFEIANVYIKNKNDLPNEVLTLAGVMKYEKVSFYETKGIVEQLLNDFAVKNFSFKDSEKGALGASVFINKEYLGDIEVLDEDLINFELNFDLIVKNSTNNKIYKSFAKYPPIIEDITLIIPEDISTENIINNIKNQSKLVMDVSLLDIFKDSKTFHIIYQDYEKNLTNEDVSKIREKIIRSLEEKFGAKLKKN